MKLLNVLLLLQDHQLKETVNLKELKLKNIKLKYGHLELSSQITDQAVQIKINEVNNLIETLDKTVNVTSDNIVNILQYLELVEELKTAHG